ncbi:MAG: tRNA (N(6)-L-threonylcarbamoyladenosine(37)-C(2))-methylthiotransferase MtaB [bacterium]|nr:tRNA (N(6)-L-threonylcarbamoyladenosine(37)-C(2))-methylthiotransferase MtaB [bacterium]
MSKPEIITFGCRLNSFESEVMRTKMSEAGVEKAIVVNTCAVTNEAVRQSRQSIRKLRCDNPDVRIIVTGCAAQINPGQYEKMDEVDFIIGNDDKMNALTWQGLRAGELTRVKVNDIFAVEETARHMIKGFGGRARAYVQIQNGCDHRCTFCIIPYGRGNSRSVPAGDIVEQIRCLCGEGFNEVVLTGVDITAYGADLPGSLTLGKLSAKILALVPELARLRISSIDAVECDDALLELITHEPRLMPHLHVSLQAGDDMILKRMKRRHNTSKAVEFCAMIRERRPDMVFGADIIAGFPTESDEMFENSLRHVDDCGLTYLHVFPFSAREGTPAARMPQLNGVVVKQRAARLREKGAQRLDQYLKSQQGQTVQVLVERGLIGRTPQFAEIRLDQPARSGAMIKALVTGVSDDHMLLGQSVMDESAREEIVLWERAL